MVTVTVRVTNHAQFVNVVHPPDDSFKSASGGTDIRACALRVRLSKSGAHVAVVRLISLCTFVANTVLVY